MEILLYYGIGVIIFGIGIALFKNNFVDYCTIMSMVGAFFILPVIDVLFKYIRNLNQLFDVIVGSIFYRNTKIRLSISYLFKIKIDGNYFLVKGKRINQYQPVGGVYKYYEEAKGLFEKLEIEDDDCIAIDESSRDDLRIRVPGKNLGKFFKWFMSQKQREISTEREFYEEMIESGILSSTDFPYIKCSFRNRVIETIKNNEYFMCKEILIADIYEIKLNDKQRKIFSELMKQTNQEYLWCNEDQINSLGAEKGKNSSFAIARTAKWTI